MILNFIRMRYVIYILCSLLTLSLIAQDKKVEKESKLNRSEVPPRIEQLLSEFLNEAKHISFYQEEDGEENKIEAKFNFEGSFYSVEFNDSLQLEDVEVIVKENEIEPGVMLQINEYLSSFDKAKILSLIHI